MAKSGRYDRMVGIMNFKRNVQRHGSGDVQRWASHPSFPPKADWRKLKLFVNKYDVPEDVVAELEQIHDDFYCRRDELRLLGRW
ncbi:MAG: hypothetical protein PWR06_2348 [Thermoanaerobacteraceae bacterium]|nr:hypothetical protein [Thermoanaerobacteraceae bacterium]